MGRSVLACTLAHVARRPAPAPALAAADALLPPDTVASPTEQDIFPRSHGPESDVDPEAARRMGLSSKEIAFFKEFGYIVKRGLVPVEDINPWLDKFWEDIVPPSVDRNDASTWTDPGKAEGWGPSAETVAESERMVEIMGRSPNRACECSTSLCVFSRASKEAAAQTPSPTATPTSIGRRSAASRTSSPSPPPIRTCCAWCKR